MSTEHILTRRVFRVLVAMLLAPRLVAQASVETRDAPRAEMKDTVIQGDALLANLAVLRRALETIHLDCTGTTRQGTNLPKRMANMELQPAERWQMFDVYYPMLFPSADMTWTFRVRAPGRRASNQRGINGGAFYFLRLPNSRIEVDLPIIGFFPVGERPDGGLKPDVLVRERWTDVGAGRDRAMDAARGLIRR